MNERIKKMYESRPKSWVWSTIILAVVLGLLVYSYTYIDSANSSEFVMTVLGNIAYGFTHPDWTLFNLTIYGIPYLLFETICIAFLGTIFGSLLALPLAFATAPNLVPRWIAWIGRTITMAIRTIPSFVYGLMFVMVVGVGAFNGVLTMSIISISMLTKLFVENIEDLNFGILESMSAMGCGTFNKIRHGVLPQLMPDFMSTILYRFDMNLRDATVLGIVGGGGIGFSLIAALNAHRWDDAAAYLYGLVILVFIIEFISGRIRVKLARG